MDNISFSSQEELYSRLLPALNAKNMELKRMGYSYIKKEDIWNYLKDTKWVKASGLMLADMVNDILHSNNEKIDLYVKNNLSLQDRKINLDD